MDYKIPEKIREAMDRGVFYPSGPMMPIGQNAYPVMYPPLYMAPMSGRPCIIKHLNGTEEKAIFRDFGVNYDECMNGVGVFSTAIVELENGRLWNVGIDLVRFTDKVKQDEAAKEHEDD